MPDRKNYRTHFRRYVVKDVGDEHVQEERPMCGSGKDAVHGLTSDRSKVDCGRCLKQMEVEARKVQRFVEDA